MPKALTGENQDKRDDELPADQAEARRDEILKRLLRTPPQPQAPKGEPKHSAEKPKEPKAAARQPRKRHSGSAG